MATRKMIIPPGVMAVMSQTLAGGRWWASQLVRFFQGMVQKLGGWTAMSSVPLIGTGRGMLAWADLAGNPYLAVGTEQRLQLLFGGLWYDITPIRATTNPAVSFSTVIHTATVTITDTGSGVAVGDWVYINVPVSVGGLIIQGFYQVQTVVDANNYTITAAGPATATVTNGGVVPSFATTMSLSTVTVTFANHGQALDSLFTVQVPTTVGGLTLSGQYLVTSPTTNTFVITAASTASSTTSGSENGGDAQILYLIPTGLASATVEGGYGSGEYGAGEYGGSGGGGVVTPLRQWFLDHFGQDLVGNYTGSPLFVWVPPVAPGNVALAINTTNYPGALDPPEIVASSAVSTPQQQVICFGADVPGTGDFDPNLVRWCDSGDFTDWEASVSNLAGSFRIPTGSRIVGGLVSPQFIVIWTDVDMWLMQYVGFPLVWGFNKVAEAVDLLAARCSGDYKSIVVGITNERFFKFDGSSVQNIPCTVWDVIFNPTTGLDRTQKDKVFCAVNSWFGEATWYFPSLAGNGECDSYVKYNLELDCWDYGLLGRTCWQDDNVFGAPIGCESNTNLVQQHETSRDANGAPLVCSVTSGFYDIEDGSLYTFVERLIPDLIVHTTANPPLTPTVQFSVMVQNYDSEAVTQIGPIDFSPTTMKYLIMRLRGRSAAIQVSSNQLGLQWRLGAMRYVSSAAGSR
jgi:hypothetical protein